MAVNGTLERTPQEVVAEREAWLGSEAAHRLVLAELDGLNSGLPVQLHTGYVLRSMISTD